MARPVWLWLKTYFIKTFPFAFVKTISNITAHRLYEFSLYNAMGRIRIEFDILHDIVKDVIVLY